MIDSSRFRYPERAIVFLAICYLVVGCAYVAGLGAGDSAACREPFPPPIRLGKLPMYSTITMVSFVKLYLYTLILQKKKKKKNKSDQNCKFRILKGFFHWFSLSIYSNKYHDLHTHLKLKFVLEGETYRFIDFIQCKSNWFTGLCNKIGNFY